MVESVLYAELTPRAFRERVAAAPIAYLPLGTLEWHGEHLPLGADGLQSQGFFERLAREVGGIVLPMLSLGPDRQRRVDGQDLYGMDLCIGAPPERAYPDGQRDGSAYWVAETIFGAWVESALAQLKRAGFRIVVAHGHGPSTKYVATHIDEWRTIYGLEALTCWGDPGDKEGLGIQVDHAAMNETSLTMALRPELVEMEQLPQDPSVWPVGVGGRDPRLYASAELGERILAANVARMAGLLRAALERVR